MKMTTIQNPFRGIPTFFKALCVDAAQGRAAGYFHVGRQFAGATPSLVSDDYESPEDFHARVEELLVLLNESDREGVWDWYEEEYPRCTPMIPARRRESFVDGVFAAHEAWEIAL